MNWYTDVLKYRYAQFTGRAHREEFWMFALINFLITIGVAIIGHLIHLPFLQGLYGLAVLVPCLALGARRLHDTGRSGWWQLLLLIPLIGLIVMIVFWVTEGTPGDNLFGTNPRGSIAGDAPPGAGAPPA
jgi:uncharacterized membrane protein YhaH (DUF805 family)